MVREHAAQPREIRRTDARAKGTIANIRNEEWQSRDVQLPRSASYTHVSDARSKDSSSLNLSLDKSSFSETDFTTTPGDTSGDVSPLESTGVNTPDEGFNAAIVHLPPPQDLISQLEKVPQVTLRPLSRGKGTDGKHTFSSIHFQPSNVQSYEDNTNAASPPPTPKPRNSVTNNFSRRLNRRSWLGTKSTEPSRSPSPQPRQKENVEIADASAANGNSSAPVSPVVERKKSIAKRRESLKPQQAATEEESRPASREHPDSSTKHTSSVIRKKRATGIFRSSSKDDEQPATYEPTGISIPSAKGASSSTSVTKDTPSGANKSKRRSLLSLPKSFSTERLPTYSSDQPLSPTVPTPVPRLLSSEQIAKGGLKAPRKKDELWSVFRGLDGDFSKFTAKSVAFKANVVRTSLIPFLRTYSAHPSSKKLRAEDLDRRVNILNKWWTGLIELLHGRNNQSISGTDRPAILDGIAGIMERSEWRLPPSPLSPLSERLKGTATPRNRSTTSLASEASDFLIESVHHNVRNIFIQNLCAQMAFVVDKMSLRHASASLVSFCGKACAFAFMFVPGMADILVRLWDVQMGSLRRVLQGNGVDRSENLSETSGSIASAFPPALQPLAFTSLAKYMRVLRTTPSLPLGTAHIQWWGRWLDRWSGRESDLFYVFVKYFHILATDFLLADSTNRERMCAPGFLPVHAQILTNLDATIHRDANQTVQDPGAAGSAASFDDIFADPDAVAATIPMPPPTNATRLMSENRLVMLIRDFLSECAAEHPAARRIFADSFNKLLQITARGTSMFDHAACYTLLDFLEEAMVLLVRFERVVESDDTLLDFDFWMTVWTKMIQSENTMTKIRLYAFVYTVWNTVICELGRKNDLCSQILLDPLIFSSQFNHYCPMVRAYFMRLLCWRVGRVDGEYSENDVVLLEGLFERLQVTYSQHLFLREQARTQDTQSPPTNPCNPAPNRRLLIIRTDPQLGSASAFLSFDGIVPPRTPTEATPLAMKRSSTISSISNVMELRTRPDSSLSVSSDSTEIEPRGRSGNSIGGFIRNLIGSKGRSKSQSRSPSKPIEEEVPAVPQLLRAATDDFSGQARAAAAPASTPVQQPPFRNFSFKFSLEYHPNARPMPPMRLMPPRLPLPAQQMLQTYSQKADTSTPIRLVRPTGESAAHAKYAGRALAEWAVVLGECVSFFERRRNEGVPGNKLVETPALGVEVFRRPG